LFARERKGKTRKKPTSKKKIKDKSDLGKEGKKTKNRGKRRPEKRVTSRQRKKPCQQQGKEEGESIAEGKIVPPIEFRKVTQKSRG